MKIKEIITKEFIFQLIKFCIVGVVNTLSHLGIYYLLLHFGLHYIASYAIAFVLSVLISYLLNSLFVFKSAKSQKGRKLVKTYLSYSFTLVISTSLLYLLTDVWKISELIAPILILTITVPINFFLNKFWVHRKAKSLENE